MTDKFRARVITAAEAALKASGSVGPLELFNWMGMLSHSHIEAWRKRDEHYPSLEPWIQVGPEKFQKTLRYFAEWVQSRGLRPVEAAYASQTPRGVARLQVTENGDAERERFYRTHYALAELNARKAQQLATKLNKATELVVFEKVSEDGNCTECGVELQQGTLLFLEAKQPVCLACADMDHLVFLPAGDAALSRRARKHSPLSAVVVRFNRKRKRYERQGILVTQLALTTAETECAADAPTRAARRAQAVGYRQAEDTEFLQAVTALILERFPLCPPDEARAIAAHTTLRGSGRVGRSAAGRALDSRAVELAVIAHIRHEHTNYDSLLMNGSERRDARTLVREKIEQVLARWVK